MFGAIAKKRAPTLFNRTIDIGSAASPRLGQLITIDPIPNGSNTDVELLSDHGQRVSLGHEDRKLFAVKPALRRVLLVTVSDETMLAQPIGDGRRVAPD